MNGVKQKRFDVVGTINGEPVIAEDAAQAGMNTYGSKAKRVIGMILRLPPADRLEVISAFDEKGSLIIPWD